MDCKTARQFLDFSRPRLPELEAAELEELESHLADCPDCGPLAQVERQMDSRLGQAMRAVPVPEHLQARLLSRLDADRQQRRRQTRRWAAGLSAAAAALLVAGWLGWEWLERPRPLDVEEAGDYQMAKVFNPRPDFVQEFFRAEGIQTVAPADANYGLLHDYYVDSLQGKRVPNLVFSDGKNDAHVIILSTKEFDVAQAMRLQPWIGSGWLGELRYDSTGRYCYLVIYLGEPFPVFPKQDKEPEA